MAKISLKPNNDYCPQTLFLYGTYDENGNPDFGLFCWFSYTRTKSQCRLRCMLSAPDTIYNLLIYRHKCMECRKCIINISFITCIFKNNVVSLRHE